MTPKDVLRVYVQKFRRDRTTLPVSQEIKTLYHWKILVVIFLFSVFSVLAAGFLMYQNISRGEFIPVVESTTTGPKLVSTELLNTTIQYFETKSEAYKQVRKSSTTSVDPSR